MPVKPPVDPAALPYRVESGLYKKQINNLEDPSKNHPIHDSVEFIEYGGRYAMAVALDGVSESKSEGKALVPISRELGWNLSKFCHKERPEDIVDIAAWFHQTTLDDEYKNKGNTTVALIRFDKQTGIIDGFNVGDSVVLVALDRLRPSEESSQGEELIVGAEVVAPLHCVANNPGIIYRGWRHSQPFEPDFFHFRLPDDWVNAYLLAMSDGYEKISDQVAGRLYDLNEADQSMANRFPDFARVYLPDPIAAKIPEVERSVSGRVLRSSLRGREDIWNAISAYYDQGATEDEQRELEVIDLDCLALLNLRKNARNPEAIVAGKSVRDLFEDNHRSLLWMVEARYMASEDESGLEEYLRGYVMAEMFAQAMIDDLFSPDQDPKSSINHRLHVFGESLGAVADDICFSVVSIKRNE